MRDSAELLFPNEDKMYVAWSVGAQPATRYVCRDRRVLTILSPGRRNLGPGPDFLDAVLLLDGELLVGPVEMHRREGEWFDHGHHLDPVYDGVILHVIAEESREIRRRTELPTLLLGKNLRSDRDEDLAEDGSDKRDLYALLSSLSWDRFVGRLTWFRMEEPTAEPSARLLVSVFDALGFSSNREPMKRVARRLIRGGLPGNARGLLQRTVEVAGLPSRRGEQLLGRFGISYRESSPMTEVASDWNFRVRPGNRPEVRLVAGAVLLDRLFLNNGLERLRHGIMSKDLNLLREELLVRSGGFSFLGSGRADTMIIDVFLPYFAARAINTPSPDLLTSVCHLYRHYPSLVPNVRLREFSRRFLAGRRLRGGFLQQGALEYIATTGSG